VSVKIVDNFMFTSNLESPNIVKWDIKTRERTAVLRGHENPVRCFAAFGGFLYSLEMDSGVVKKWAISSDQCVETIILDIFTKPPTKILVDDLYTYYLFQNGFYAHKAGGGWGHESQDLVDIDVYENKVVLGYTNRLEVRDSGGILHEFADDSSYFPINFPLRNVKCIGDRIYYTLLDGSIAATTMKLEPLFPKTTANGNFCDPDVLVKEQIWELAFNSKFLFASTIYGSIRRMDLKKGADESYFKGMVITYVTNWYSACI
jgi:WD40 repeat protein